MNSLIKFSIIIPHKNIPDLLERCLNSIPDVDDIQVIVVDDNSEPEKGIKCDFAGMLRSNTKFIFNKQSCGAGHARNTGLRQAEGRWLLFADADDFYNDGFYEIICNCYDSGADVVYFSATSVHSQTLLPSTRHLGLEKAIRTYNIEYTGSVKKIKYENWEPWSKMFSRSYIQELGIYFDEIMIGNDIGFVLKAGHFSSKIDVFNFPLYCVTFRDDSLSFDNSETAFDNRFKAVLLINKYMREFNSENVLPLIPHIYRGKKYGIRKIFELTFLAVRTNNNIFHGSYHYFCKCVAHVLSKLKQRFHVSI